MEERQLLKRVRESVGAQPPLVSTAEQLALDPELSEEQAAAVRHVLGSKDAVTSIRGRAGTGKSRLLEAVTESLDQMGVGKVALAPTAAASRGSLRESGIEDADTMAQFLSPSEHGQALRDQAKGGVIILDEAGLASTADVLKLMNAAHEINARVYLVGDKGQLGSVPRGDALRLIEEQTGLIPADLRTIYRRTEERYLDVVNTIADGKAVEGLQKAR